jgi:hypothetical protein
VERLKDADPQVQRLAEVVDRKLAEVVPHGLGRNVTAQQAMFLTAMALAAQMVRGAAAMVQQSGRHPGELKDAVASPGGTTIAGIHELERGGFRGAVMSAVTAAAARSRELGAPAR